MGETEAKDREIERLRDGIKEAEQIVHDSGRLLGEAHQEIERLRGALDWCGAKRDEHCAEIERLRGALQGAEDEIETLRRKGK